jgi:hypothetical protein
MKHNNVSGPGSKQLAFPTKQEAATLREKCSVVIIEVMTTWTRERGLRIRPHQFIELAKLCGSGAIIDSKHDLGEYILLIIKYVLGIE